MDQSWAPPPWPNPGSVTEMANTKKTKRKGQDEKSIDSPSQSESETDMNQGNGDLVIEVDDLSHLHTKCDDPMEKLQALNEAASHLPSVPISTSLLVSPMESPVQTVSTPVQAENNTNLAKLPVTDVAVDVDSQMEIMGADAVANGLIDYLTDLSIDSVKVQVSGSPDNSDNYASGDIDKENESNEKDLIKISRDGVDSH